MSDIIVHYTPDEAREHYLLARRLELSGYWLLADIERAAKVWSEDGAVVEYANQG